MYFILIHKQQKITLSKFSMRPLIHTNDHHYSATKHTFLNGFYSVFIQIMNYINRKFQIVNQIFEKVRKMAPDNRFRFLGEFAVKKEKGIPHLDTVVRIGSNYFSSLITNSRTLCVCTSSILWGMYITKEFKVVSLKRVQNNFLDTCTGTRYVTQQFIIHTTSTSCTVQ